MKEIYQETSKYIYLLASKRIYSRKKSMKLTYYELAGYANQVDYETSAKKTGYDPKMINKITRGKCNRNNRYLIPDMYVDLLTYKLRFNNEHDLLWGKTEEIKQYGSKLFECLLIDCIDEDVKVKSNILSLISDFGRESTEITTKKVDNILKIFLDDNGTVEDLFIRFFTNFTHNKYNSTNQVGNEGVIEFNRESNFVTNFNDADYLTFKKLPESIEFFVKNVFSPFFMKVYISELVKRNY
ncbi:hypothetical protein HF326_16910 [Bacillus altitudinis MN12]|uniref:hypothetical protein n=1 Tax=Bacillus altitudinis TaxID=293387 RepID=UPI001B817291|nr:hypothetical protein [Bacillus altitudinis]MBR0584733.1 hypothetical protein [Bacillus altitudinis MN12]MBR0595792.1 hypothetical protein [Bacillus altitudinis C16B11]MBR0609764.1 hypothetical protein [Bacillus altitudinis]